MDPNPKAVCQLLALAVEHVDTMLEDWYPSLGTRFLHTSEGKMLVTRLVPCPRCLTTHNERENTKSWQDWSFLKVNLFQNHLRKMSNFDKFDNSIFLMMSNFWEATTKNCLLLI